MRVWRYSADSAAWIFGDSLGDPTADEIWSAAKERPAGLTRTEVSDMFSRNKETERALGVLEDAGRLRREPASPTAADLPRCGSRSPPKPRKATPSRAPSRSDQKQVAETSG